MPSNNKCSVTSNPNPRSSEISNPMRRSFTGNPFANPSIITNPRTIFPNTPANSPSDFPRRNTAGDLDDKENGKDHILKSAKVRSPAACSKSSKNFMSPTISASFKITDSPRKKVLIERNEAAPTSVPSTDAKTHIHKVTFADPLECGDSKLEENLDALLDGIHDFEDIQCSSLTCEDMSGESVPDDANVRVPDFEDIQCSSLPCEDMSGESVPDDANVPSIQKDDIEPSFETVAEESYCVNLDPTFRLSPTPPPLSSTSTIFMPPYDPETNYLSPRPQFLHYKPKSRMEVCSEREFEDSFISGSFSDIEDTQSEGSQKEPDDVSSDEIVTEETGRISETNPARTFMPDEANQVPKPRFYMRSKAIALVLLLSVAFISISVTNSPVIDHTVFEDFYEWGEFSEFAKAANFDRFSQIAKPEFEGLARNFHIWFTKSLSSISELISSVRGVHNLAQLQHCNLTGLHDYIVVNQYPIFGRGENEIVDTPEEHPPVLNVQESDDASEIGTDEGIGDISAEHYEVYEEQIMQDITAVEKALYAPESEEVGQPATMIESEQALQLAEAGNLEAKQAQEDDVDFNLENASDASQVLEDQLATMIESEQALQPAEAGNLEAKQAQEDDANFNLENASDASQVVEDQPAIMIESEQALQLAVAGNSESKQPQDDDANFNVQNQPGLNSEAAEIIIEVYGAGNVNTKQAQESDADKQRNIGLEHWPGSDSEVGEIRTEVYNVKAEGKPVSIDAAIRGNEQRSEAIDIPPSIVLYLLLCGGTALIACAAFNWSRKGKSRSKRVTSSVFGKELHTNNSKLAPKEPCPSEMSSFEKSSSYSKKVVDRLNEAHSLEKKRKNIYRRESLASSSDYSMGSPSYGSLTVLEKIPSKQVNGDEETITPVRRSSRIRNQATSPS